MGDEAKMVRDRLVVPKEQVFADVVGKAEKWFQLDERGNPRLLVEISRFTDRPRVELFLLSRHLAGIGELRENDVATPEEISGFCGLKVKTVHNRLGELKTEGKVESPSRGQYRLVSGRMRDILRDLEGA
ncbi:MAG TPA: hypothetical protein VEO18_01290 [Thermoplasmata archaeon]|nr:hypothetical protein [Thermoplasmata archaeon]